MGVNVKHITSISEAPLPLTDRFGEYHDELMLIEHWGLMTRLDAIKIRNILWSRYVESEVAEPEAGNPASFMTSDITFLAEYEGQLCVHAEVELDFCEADNPADFDNEPSDVVTPEEFKRRVAVWGERLAALVPYFPHTTFFLSSEITFDGRLTLNAVTPLANGVVGNRRIAPEEVGFFMSPYVLSGQSEASLSGCETIDAIASLLEDLAFEPNTEASELLKAKGFTPEQAGGPADVDATLERGDRHTVELQGLGFVLLNRTHEGLIVDVTADGEVVSTLGVMEDEFGSEPEYAEA